MHLADLGEQTDNQYERARHEAEQDHQSGRRNAGLDVGRDEPLARSYLASVGAMSAGSSLILSHDFLSVILRHVPHSTSARWSNE